jgi:hypothetical protein
MLLAICLPNILVRGLFVIAGNPNAYGAAGPPHQVSRGLSDETRYLARVTSRANMIGRYAIDANSNCRAR